MVASKLLLLLHTVYKYRLTKQLLSLYFFFLLGEKVSAPMCYLPLSRPKAEAGIQSKGLAGS